MAWLACNVSLAWRTHRRFDPRLAFNLFPIIVDKCAENWKRSEISSGFGWLRHLLEPEWALEGREIGVADPALDPANLVRNRRVVGGGRVTGEPGPKPKGEGLSLFLSGFPIAIIAESHGLEHREQGEKTIRFQNAWHGPFDTLEGIENGCPSEAPEPPLELLGCLQPNYKVLLAGNVVGP